MGKKVNELGKYLQESYPNNFRLSSENHWKINIVGQWIQLPDHYWTGLVMIFGGITGLRKSKNENVSFLLFLIIYAGIALVIDDIEDLVADAKKLIKKLFG